MKHESDILKRIKSYFMRRKSAREAYEFEREAERDPFLYEAMEGFESMLSSDIQQALDELDDKIDAKTTKNIFSLNWQAAASVGVFIGVSTMLYFVVFSGPDAAENEVATESDDSMYVPREKEVSFDSMEAATWATIDSAVTDSASTLDLETAVATTEGSSGPRENTTPPELPESPAVSEPFADIAFAEEANEIVEIADSESDESVLMDSETVVIRNEELSMATRSVENVIMEEAAGMPAPAKSTASIEASETEATVVRAQPKGGMSAFQGYVKKNIKMSEGMPAGTVVLTFELDRKGRPKKIAVAKSLCTACDAEAVRLLENGPTWEQPEVKNNKSEPEYNVTVSTVQSVSIQFSGKKDK